MTTNLEEIDPLDLEEKSSLEKNFQKQILLLKNMLSINDEIVLQNEEKVKLIVDKEKILERLKEQNKEDIIQLELENQCQYEYLNYEIEINDTKIKELNRLLTRNHELEDENCNLQNYLSNLIDKFNSEGIKYAEEMHMHNKSMQQIRQEMESIYSRKLVDMDVKFQEDAFISLDDKKKKNLLIHSKLRDEIALQKNGLSNLYNRISKEKTNYESINKNLEKLNKKMMAIRNKLKVSKIDILNCKNNMESNKSNIKMLLRQKKAFHEELFTWPLESDIHETINVCEYNLLDIENEFKIWSDRMEKIDELESDIIAIKNVKNIFQQPISIEHKNLSININIIRKALQMFPELKTKFDLLLNQSNIINYSQGSTSIDSNPVNWLLYKIITIWDAEFFNDFYPQIDLGGNFKNNYLTKTSISENNLYESPKDVDIENEIEFLWDEAFPNNHENLTNYWLKTVNPPENHPVDNDFNFRIKPRKSKIEAGFVSLIKNSETITLPCLTQSLSRHILPPFKNNSNLTISSDSYNSNSIINSSRNKSSYERHDLSSKINITNTSKLGQSYSVSDLLEKTKRQLSKIKSSLSLKEI